MERYIVRVDTRYASQILPSTFFPVNREYARVYSDKFQLRKDIVGCKLWGNMVSIEKIDEDGETISRFSINFFAESWDKLDEFLGIREEK